MSCVVSLGIIYEACVMILAVVLYEDILLSSVYICFLKMAVICG
jgi:hypothetical protein